MRSGELFTLLGPSSSVLWVGPLVEHVPWAYALGLSGLGVGLWGLSGALRRGELHAPDWLVWGPLAVTVALPLPAVLALVEGVFSPQVSALGADDQVRFTAGMLAVAFCALPLMAWAYSQHLLATRYGAIEIGEQECVLHKAGAWTGPNRVRPEDLVVSFEDEQMRAQAGGASCGGGARTQAAVDELHASLALCERDQPRIPRESVFPSALVLALLVAAGATAWRWGVWWIVPSLGVALLAGTVGASLWERLSGPLSGRFRRRVWLGFGLWSLALLLWPTLPLESSFERRDVLGNQVVVVARPGAPAHRALFLSGALRPDRAGRLRRLWEDEKSPSGTVFWSTKGRASGRPLRDSSGVALWLYRAQDELFGSLWICEHKPLDPALRDFLGGRSAKSVLMIRSGAGAVRALLCDGQVSALFWSEGDGRLSPTLRPPLSQIDPLPSFAQVRWVLDQDPERSPEAWRSLAPRRAERFASREQAWLGWISARELLRPSPSPWLQPLPRAWGIPVASPHATILRLRLGIRALESLRDHAPERAPEVTLAIARAQARIAVARWELNLRRACWARLEASPSWLRPAARAWMHWTRDRGWTSARRVGRKGRKRRRAPKRRRKRAEQKPSPAR